MGQNNGRNGAQNGLLHHMLVKNGPKGLETVQNYRKGGKNFQKFDFFINSKKFKTLYNI